MKCFGKVFKSFNKSKYDFILSAYNNSQQSYTELIKSQRKKGNKQVLFNSEVMIAIIKKTASHSNNYFLYDIDINIDDHDIISDINDVTMSIREDLDNVTNLLEQLKWFNDEDSIDIAKIYITSTDFKNTFEISSSGMYDGELSSFDHFLKPALESYFNG